MAVILLVGFDEPFLEKLNGWFELSDFSGVNVMSVDEALAFCLQGPKPDLVFFYQGASVVSGFDLLARLEEHHFDIPVVFYARAPDVPTVVGAFKNGVSDFITRSTLDRSHLLACFSKEIEKKKDFQHKQKSLLIENRLLRSRFEALSADQEAGHLAQLKLFPPTPFRFHQYQFSHRIIPSLLLSGDFIDYFKISEDECGFYLADVSGHGASSAFVTVLLKCLMNDIRKSENQSIGLGVRSPGAVFQHINRELIQMSLNKHVAMFYGVINCRNNTLVYSLAAHYPLPILDDGKKARFIGGASLPLGVDAKLGVEEYTEPLPEKFSLVMFTDGIMNVLPQDNLLDKEQELLKMVDMGCSALPAISQKLGLDDFKSGSDDIGILVIEG